MNSDACTSAPGRVDPELMAAIDDWLTPVRSGDLTGWKEVFNIPEAGYRCYQSVYPGTGDLFTIYFTGTYYEIWGGARHLFPSPGECVRVSDDRMLEVLDRRASALASMEVSS